MTGILAAFGLAAGAILFAAGGVHTAKSVSRPAVTAGTLGTANPAVSLAEDAVSGVTTVLAVVAPVVMAALIVLGAYWVIRWRRRRKRG